MDAKSLHSIVGIVSRYYAFHVYKKPYKCSKCGNEGRVEVHHKDKNRENFDVDNLVVLCRKCHNLEHGVIKYADLELPLVSPKLFKSKSEKIIAAKKKREENTAKYRERLEKGLFDTANKKKKTR